MLDPEVVVIGGGLAEAGELFLGAGPRRVRRAWSWRADHRPTVPDRRRRARARGRRDRCRAAGSRSALVTAERVTGAGSTRGSSLGSAWSSAGSPRCRRTSSRSSTR